MMHLAPLSPHRMQRQLRPVWLIMWYLSPSSSLLLSPGAPLASSVWCLVIFGARRFVGATRFDADSNHPANALGPIRSHEATADAWNDGPARQSYSWSPLTITCGGGVWMTRTLGGEADPQDRWTRKYIEPTQSNTFYQYYGSRS